MKKDDECMNELCEQANFSNRVFSVKAIYKVECLTLSMQSIDSMKRDFPD